MGGARRGKDAAAGRAAESTCAQHTVLPSPRTRTPAQGPFRFAAGLRPSNPFLPARSTETQSTAHLLAKTQQELPHRTDTSEVLQTSPVTCHTVIVALQFEFRYSATVATWLRGRAGLTAPRLT